jgi:hypothetical protein
MLVDTIFSVSLLDPAANEPLPGQRKTPPPHAIVNDVEEYGI